MDVRQISLIEEQARRFRDLQSKRSAGTLTEEEHAEWRELLEHYAPTLLSAGKAREENVHSSPPEFHYGKAITVREGRDATIIATGGILKTVTEAADLLSQQGLAIKVLSMPFIKPLDAEGILKVARESRILLTVEEHNPNGGLGGAVAEVLSEAGVSLPYFRRLGVSEDFLRVVGSQDYLKQQAGISREGLARTVLEALERCKHD